MANHEGREEYVNRSHDFGWDNLRPGIVPIEVARREDSDQDCVQECSIVGKRSLTEALEDGRADLKRLLLAADLLVEQVHNDLLDAGQLLGSLLRVLADVGDQEY